MKSMSNLFITNLSASNTSSTNLIVTNLLNLGITSTNLVSSSITSTNLVSSSITSTNLLATNCTISSSLNYSGRATALISGNGTQAIPNTTTTALTNSYWNSGAVQITGPITYSNGVFTINRSGWYNVIVAVVFTANAGGNERNATILRNSSNISSNIVTGFNGTIRCIVQTSTNTLITSGQTISVSVYQSSGGSLNMSSGEGFISIVEF